MFGASVSGIDGSECESGGVGKARGCQSLGRPGFPPHDEHTSRRPPLFQTGPLALERTGSLLSVARIYSMLASGASRWVLSARTFRPTGATVSQAPSSI